MILLEERGKIEDMSHGYHVIDGQDWKPLPYCRVCGIQIEETTYRGNICRDCFNMEKQQYYQLHKEQCKQYVDPEKQKVATQRWQKANPEKVLHRTKLHQYRRLNADGFFTQQEWQDKLKEYGNKCAYCNGELGNHITVDHDIPLSRGGSNYIDNLVPACQTCNSRKHTKTGDEFKVLSSVVE